jgi:hypothetical protein
MLQELKSLQRQELLKSIKTAVWIVMCKHPAMREPASGCSSFILNEAIKPGISASASSISLPQAAREISFTLKPQRHSCSTHL